jgi:hypothetical protein
VAKTRRTITTGTERLRAESPAYRPTDDWQELPPQAMEVVMSLRLDAATARRVAEFARRSGQTPSGWIRAWLQDQLLGAKHEVSKGAIKEDRAAYRLNDYEALRDRYRPSTIRILLVGESRPAGGTFFYLANSRLYSATREAFLTARGAAASGSAFLEQLRADGIWLYDLSEAPVNRSGGRPRRDAIAARTAGLVDLIRDERPGLVVVIKRSLEAIVRSAMSDADLPASRLRVLPFPLYQWRAKYVAGLAAILAGDAGNMRRGAGKPHPPSAPRPRSNRTQPITPSDVEHGRIRVPKGSKHVLPDAKGLITVDLRGRQLEVSYDPRIGPDRSRSAVLRVPRQVLAETVEPYESLSIEPIGDEIRLS